MERQPGPRSRPVRDGEQFQGFGFGATELAAERPVGTGAFVKDAHAHVGARSVFEDLVELGIDVDGKHHDATGMRVRDVARLLDGVAVGQIGGIGAAAKQRSISSGLATSNVEPNSTSSASMAEAGLAFTA